MAAETAKIVKTAISEALELRKREKIPEAAAQLSLAAGRAKGNPELEQQVQDARKEVDR